MAVFMLQNWVDVTETIGCAKEQGNSLFLYRKFISTPVQRDDVFQTFDQSLYIGFDDGVLKL